MTRLNFRSVALAAALASLSLVGCKKDPPTSGGTSAEGAGAAATGAAATAAPAQALVAPANVMLYGGTQALSQSLGALTKLANQVLPVPDLTAMIAPALQGQYRLRSGSVVDTSKPVRFAIFDPKEHPRNPLALAFGITGTEALLKAMPEVGRKEGDAGNQWSYLKYKGAKRPIYVNAVGGFAVITRDATMFPQNKAFIEALLAAPMPDQASVYVEVGHLLKAFGPQFDAGLADLKRTFKSAARAVPGGAVQMGPLLKAVDWMGATALEVDQVQISLATSDDGAALKISAASRPGSKLHKMLSNIKGRGAPKLLDRFPPDAPFFVAATFDTAALARLTTEMAESFLVGPMFGGDAAHAKPYLDAMVSYARGLDGELVLAAHDTAGGLGLTGLFGLRDAPAARAAMKQLAGLYTDPVAKAYYHKTGVEVDYKPAAYTVGKVPVDIISTSLANLPPQAAMMAGLVKSLMTQHIALGDSVGVIAYGDDARATVEQQIGGTGAGGLSKAPGVLRAARHAVKDYFFLLYVSPIELAKRIKLSGMNPLATVLSGITETTGLGISAGAEAGALKVVIDVPIDSVKQGMVAFEKSKGAF